MLAPVPRETSGPCFAEALGRSLEIAALSPSSHNCQPWGLARVAGDGDGERLVLALDRGRELNALPAHEREMYLSCGLFWRILRRALAAQGWIARPSETPGREVSGLPAMWKPLCVAEFRRGRCMGSVEELDALVRQRQTNRAPYSSEPVDSATLDGLVPEGVAGVGVRHLRTPAELRRFCSFVARHAGQDFAHHGAWRETHSFIRWSDAEAATRRDGFTPTHLFGPLSPAGWWLRRLALAPPTMAMLRHVGYPRLLASQLAAVVRRSPAIVVMTLPQDDPSMADLLSAADLLADYWLHATAAGLVLHPISIVIQHEDLHARLQAEFGLSGRTFFVARVGYPAASFPSTPRRRPTAAFRELC